MADRFGDVGDASISRHALSLKFLMELRSAHESVVFDQHEHDNARADTLCHEHGRGADDVDTGYGFNDFSTPGYKGDSLDWLFCISSDAAHSRSSSYSRAPALYARAPRSRICSCEVSSPKADVGEAYLSREVLADCFREELKEASCCMSYPLQRSSISAPLAARKVHFARCCGFHREANKCAMLNVNSSVAHRQSQSREPHFQATRSGSSGKGGSQSSSCSSSRSASPLF